MKIIATTSTGFLVDASKSELANICGYYSSYSMPREGNFLVPNTEIAVNERYASIETLRRQEHAVRDAQLALRAAAESLNLALPLLEEITSELSQHEVK